MRCQLLTLDNITQIYPDMGLNQDKSSLLCLYHLQHVVCFSLHAAVVYEISFLVVFCLALTLLLYLQMVFVFSLAKKFRNSKLTLC
ncbi:hypothetical protein CWB99_17055 [Pseudoalteromonas rubra]|uniref:Uncharacterized protein n=1 Tax=Pseudoalteromonas rubra TaxID=43658 RepID=A0A5S3WHW1_9GAMM|nr:hypothetical protein CWB99_17055 [Pseudoalteromonas rubra]TMP33808.1 hypothetical protein CWC00_09890 [Pseudoalteromonas rubra]